MSIRNHSTELDPKNLGPRWGALGCSDIISEGTTLLWSTSCGLVAQRPGPANGRRPSSDSPLEGRPLGIKSRWQRWAAGRLLALDEVLDEALYSRLLSEESLWWGRTPSGLRTPDSGGRGFPGVKKGRKNSGRAVDLDVGPSQAVAGRSHGALGGRGGRTLVRR